METPAQPARTKDRNAQAVDVLRRLNDLGAINLETMISKADEIRAVTRGGGGSSVASELEPQDGICYPFYIKLGPRLDVDIVSVASELRALGFEVKRVATTTK
jgi:hypothetical protein